MANHDDTIPNNNEDKPSKVSHKKNIRHLEKRRISTCAFADRIAHAALDVYRSKVLAMERNDDNDNDNNNKAPTTASLSSSSSSLEPTCIAAVLIHDATTDTLTVVSLGVGTKFLSQSVLLQDEQCPYGRRVRDLHAEVLCRRALRRFLCQAILADLRQEEGNKSPALSSSLFDFIQRTTTTTTTRQGEDDDNDCTWQWQLRDNCTWHAYFSSTPCGNATLKKFVTLRKETFREDLEYWPVEPHAQQPGHSVHLGQFSLLVKRDASSETATSTVTTAKDDDDDKNDDTTTRPVTTTHRPPGPAVNNNIPTGTAAVHTRQGSLHTCSDKVCRWNCLGWQGSLLASLLREPLHVTSLTVGRKFSAPCLKRAICCRIAADHDKRGNNNNNNSAAATTTSSRQERKKPRFTVHHPAVMCTAVYVDTDATIIPQNTNDKAKQDLQFRETRAFVWWPGLTRAHVLDGSTGLAFIVGDGKEKSARDEEQQQQQQQQESPICTKQLTKIFLDIQREINKHTGHHDKRIPQTLTELRQFKQSVSPVYETTKDQLLTSHKVMKEWVRRAERR